MRLWAFYLLENLFETFAVGIDPNNYEDWII